MLNCIDMDGSGRGYDLPLVAAVQARVGVPVVASSGAGAVEHFSQVGGDRLRCYSATVACTD